MADPKHPAHQTHGHAHAEAHPHATASHAAHATAEEDPGRPALTKEQQAQQAQLEKEIHELAEARAKLAGEIAEQEAGSPAAKRTELARIDRMLQERAALGQRAARGNLSDEERRAQILQRVGIHDLKSALEQYDKDELSRMPREAVVAELRRRGEKAE